MPLIQSTKNLMILLKNQYAVKYFIEGGTFQGDGAAWGASQFEHVITVEKSEHYYSLTSSRLSHLDNIKFMLGDTRQALTMLSTEIKEAALYWLDAHYSGGVTAGESDECPILDEIAALVNLDQFPFLFIDDARLFLSPPPHPHKIEQWPTIDAVIEALKSSKHQIAIFVFCDVIIAVPLAARKLVADYCQDQNTQSSQFYQTPHPNQTILNRFWHKIKTKHKITSVTRLDNGTH